MAHQEEPAPAHPPLDVRVGRQLFLDDHLFAEQHDMAREWCEPVADPNNPVLRPTTSQELNNGLAPVAAPFDDGIAYDHTTREWKLWHMSGWFDGTSVRSSPDGLDWHTSPPHTVSGLPTRTGPHVIQRDGSSVAVDYAGSHPQYRMFRYARERVTSFRPHTLATHDMPFRHAGGTLYSSEDGISWTREAAAGPGGDNTTFFYDPFRAKWVFSIRTRDSNGVRERGWHEAASFIEAGQWNTSDIVHWIDSQDLPYAPAIGDLPAAEIYKVSCMPYETAMLGVFAVYRGPSNGYAESIGGLPKIIDLFMGISRDGYHFSIAPRAFLRSSMVMGSWDYGYLHVANGGILPVGDTTRIYYSAFSGLSPRLGTHMYAGGALGVAVWRRDGFCALVADGKTGVARTHKLLAAGDHLFLNLAIREGCCRVRIDRSDGTAQTFAFAGPLNDTCLGVALDKSLSAAAPVVVEITLDGDARLFALWFSDSTGASNGYSASGRIPAQ